MKLRLPEKSVRSHSSGQGLTEFIVIVVLVALIVLASVRLFGRSVRCEFLTSADQIDAGGTASTDCPADSPVADPIDAPDPPPPPPPLPTAPPTPPPPPPTPIPTPEPSPTPDIRVFDNPTLAGAPLDNCVNFATTCGQPAADNFCRIQGYTQAISFALGPPVGRTYVAGDGVYCNAPPTGCGPFSTITCLR